MAQEVFHPSGKRVFYSEDPAMYYNEIIAEQMWDAHYEVYTDDRAFPDPSRVGRWKTAPVPQPVMNAGTQKPKTRKQRKIEEPAPAEEPKQEEKPKRGRRKKTEEQTYEDLEGQTSMFG